MGIYDAMNASVTGMTAQANYLSNISQNMANSNTVGYKEADTQFATLVDQAAVGQTSAGGVMVETRNAIAQQGTLKSTSSSTDLAINGNGFFVVSDTSGASYLTRAGSFVTDANGNLVNSAGFKLMGYPIASNGVTGMTVNSLANMQVININSSSLQATPSTSGTFTANLPAADAVVAAANLPSANLATSTYSEKTSIVAYDDLGTAHTLDVYLSNTGPDASGNPTWSVSVYDHAGANATSGNFPYSSAALTNQTLAFSPTTGQLTSGSPLTFTVLGGASLSLNMGSTTQLAGSFSVTNANVNGNAASAVQSVNIGTDGTVSYQLANGSSVAVYKIPLADVPAPDEMTVQTGDVYSPNMQSGNLTVNTAGTAGLGTINSSELEQSTVDVATELTNMIIAQRGYQANSQVFKSAADLMSTLINLNLA